MCAGMRVVLIT